MFQTRPAVLRVAPSLECSQECCSSPTGCPRHSLDVTRHGNPGLPQSLSWLKDVPVGVDLSHPVRSPESGGVSYRKKKPLVALLEIRSQDFPENESEVISQG